MHKQYINQREIDFAMGVANSTKETWKLSSQNNVMGGGAGRAIRQNKGTGLSATVHPYYLEYIRRHFCELTGETIQDKSNPVWRRWRICYEA